MRFVGGIVQHLDLQQFTRIIELAHFLQQTLYHVAFVIDRQLHGHLWQPLRIRKMERWQILAEFSISAHGGIAMQTVNREDAENAEVRDEQRPVERRQTVNAGKGIVKQSRHDPRAQGRLRNEE